MLRDEDVARAVPCRLATKRTVLLYGALLLSCWLLGGAFLLLAQDEPGREQQPTEPDPWEPFRLLEGTWEGSIDGRLGQGVGRRRYEFIFDGLYLVSRHASVRLPQQKSLEGDYHRELAIYSFDRERRLIVLREFIVEGYVLRYACQGEPRRFVCVSERVEGGSGFRARLTVEIMNRYRFQETFELASPGEELEVYFSNEWTRIPDLAD